MESLSDAVPADVRLGLAGTWPLERLLGTGLLGRLYATRDADRRACALRLLHAELAQDKAFAARFVKAARDANAAAHPDCVTVLADGACGAQPFFVMELFEGESVASLLERRAGRLPPGEGLRIVRDALYVLEGAHAQGLLHQGVRPESLFVTDDGTIKIFEFGLSALRWEAARRFGLPCPPGSAAYTPPERARDSNAESDPRSDLWAIGALLFVLLSGQTVHEGDERELLERAATRTARSLGSAAPRAPAPLVALVDRALEIDLDRRFASARAMRLSIEHVMRLPELATARSLSETTTPRPRSSGVPDATRAPGPGAFNPAEPQTGVRHTRSREPADTVPLMRPTAALERARELLGVAPTEPPPSSCQADFSLRGTGPRAPAFPPIPTGADDSAGRAELARTERQLAALVEFDTSHELEQGWRLARARRRARLDRDWRTRLVDELGLEGSFELDPASREVVAARLAEPVSAARFNTVVTVALESTQRRLPNFLDRLLAALARDDPSAIERARNEGMLTPKPLTPAAASDHVPLGVWSGPQLGDTSMPEPATSLDFRLAFYAAALVAARQAYAGFGVDPESVPRLCLVARMIVQALSRDAPLADLSTLASAYRDDAARAIQSGLIAASMARRLSQDPALLFRVALAALLVDAGRSCLGAESPALDADAPNLTAATCLAAGGACASARACTLIAFEAAWLERRAELGALRGSAMGPLVASRLVHVARAWLERLAPRGSSSSHSPTEALIDAARAPDVEPTLLKLLIETVGVLPAGSVVELDDGQWAVVGSPVKGSQSLPLVPVIGPDGRALSNIRRSAVESPGEARIRRVLARAEVCFNVAGSLFRC